MGQAEKVPSVNDPVAAEGCPIESPDGLSLYIASTRRGDPNDIWVATRDSKDAEFGVPTILPTPVDSDAADFCPTPLRGNYLLFVYTREGWTPTAPQRVVEETSTSPDGVRPLGTGRRRGISGARPTVRTVLAQNSARPW